MKALTVDDFKTFLIPHCALAIKNINLAVEFRAPYSSRSTPNGEVIDANSTLPEDQRQKSALTFNAGSLSYSTDDGFAFDGLNTFAFSPSQIGDTGVTLGFTGMKLDLSRTSNIPEAAADGRPLDFVGVYIQTAQIGLPKKWFSASSNTAPGPSIVGTNIIIGPAACRAGSASTRPAHFTPGWAISRPRSPASTFASSAMPSSSSNIAGSLTARASRIRRTTMPSSPSPRISPKTATSSVTATENPGIDLIVPGVMDFKVKMLGFGRDDGRFFLETAGTITFLFSIPMLTFDRPIAVDIKKLIIWGNPGSSRSRAATSSCPRR